MRQFTIFNTMTLQELQAKFNDHFPYLKLEFFAEKHKAGEGSDKNQMIPSEWDATVKLSDIQPPDEVQNWEVTGEMTAAQLERDLEMEFGLNAQVFRKSGNTWLETTTSDNETLADLNARSEETDPSKQPHVNPYQVD